MVAVRNSAGLSDDLIRLASALESLDLRGAGYLGADTSLRDRLVSTVRSYLVPRIENPEAPFLVAVVGPTGSGKSTLVNSLSGQEIAVTGPLRPTTTMPLILSTSDQQAVIGGVECLVAQGNAPILNHMHLVDTPDLDSTASHHRAMAETIADNADVIVFVTSALRYADNVPWEVLRRAKYRGAIVIPVLNRVGPDSGAAVNDFKRRLGDAGLDDDLVRVPEHFIGAGTSRVHTLAVRDLRKRLYWVARDRTRHQNAVVNRVLNSTTDQVRELISHVTGVAAELDVVEAEMTSGVQGAASLPPRKRPWASFPLPPVPSGRGKVRRWVRRSQPNPAELEVWEASVRAGIVAETETRLLTAIATHASAILALSPRATAAASADAREMLGVAVDGWLESVHKSYSDHKSPRLATVVSVSASLTPFDAAATATVLGANHVRAVAAHREALNNRLAVVFDHVGGRLAELWRITVGDPAVDDLAARLAAVAATYQFADA